MTTRIFLAPDDDPGVVLRQLLDMVDDPRSVVWVPAERAADVPDDVASRYNSPVEDVAAADDDATGDEVDALRARLHSMGVRVDYRWGERRLRQEIAAAEARGE